MPALRAHTIPSPPLGHIRVYVKALGKNGEVVAAQARARTALQHDSF